MRPMGMVVIGILKGFWAALGEVKLVYVKNVKSGQNSRCFVRVLFVLLNMFCVLLMEISYILLLFVFMTFKQKELRKDELGVDFESFPREVLYRKVWKTGGQFVLS